MRNSILLSLVGAAVFAAPAMADGGAVTIGDACGDNNPFVQRNDTRIDLPGTPRTPRFDFKSVRITPVAGGVAASFTQCEAPGEPEGFQGFRGFYASISGACQLSIVAQDDVAPTLPRRASFAETCWDGPDKDPLPIGEDHSYTKFEVTLPANAISVTGDTMTVTVLRAGMTGDAAAALAPGSTWSVDGGLAQEQASAWGGGGDTEGNSEGFMGPTGIDFAWGHGTSFTVQ